MVEIFCLAEELYTLLSLVEAVSDEVRLSVFKDKLSLKLVDSANIIALTAEMPAMATEEIEIGLIRISMLKKLLQKKQGEVEIAVDSGKLMLALSDGIKYNLNLVDPSTIRKPPKIPTIDYKVKTNAPIKDLKEAVKLASLASDIVSFTSTKDSVVLSAEGETSKLEYKIGFNDEGELKEGEKVHLSIQNLDLILRALNPDDTVSIYFSTDSPVKFEINSNVKAAYLIAPVLKM